MRPQIFLSALVFVFGLFSISCESVDRLMSTKIKDVLDHPRNYENKELTVYGTVTNAISLVFLKYFQIEDDTGTIIVVTDRLLPAHGEKLKVTGRMTAIEIGTQKWIVLREGTVVARLDDSQKLTK